jgi:hypothetical protein
MQPRRSCLVVDSVLGSAVGSAELLRAHLVRARERICDAILRLFDSFLLAFP